MGKLHLGVNMEFVREHDKGFAWGVAKAAEIGYTYIEPMVHWGRELLSEAGYFHSVSMYDDPLWVRDLCDKHGIKLSGLSAHCPLIKPEISVEYLKQADIVVTNPPFSLFREYVAQLVAHEKKFLIIGNKNSVSYKDLFALIKQNKLWTGVRSFSGGMRLALRYSNRSYPHPRRCER